MEVIIVGIAIAVGIPVSRIDGQSSSHHHLMSDLKRPSSIALGYYRRLSSMDGGKGNFKGFALGHRLRGGRFMVRTKAPNDAGATHGSTAPIATSAQTIYIIGYGKEIGGDGRRAVKA